MSEPRIQVIGHALEIGLERQLRPVRRVKTRGVA